MVKTLNGLRALLFLFIFCTHFKYTISYSPLGKSLYNYLNLGRFAILFFIILSGFCMALGYSDKFKVLSVHNYVEYLKKRFIKFYPLYLISGLVGLIFIYLKQGINWLYLFIFVYIPMLTPWLGINSGGNISGWFLGVIFSCYLVTPPAIYWFNKKSNLRLHIIFCLINYLILVIFSSVLILLNDSQNEFLYRFPIIRIFEYIIALDIGFIFIKLLKDKLNPISVISVNSSINDKFLDNYIIKSIIDIFFICAFLLIMYVCPSNLLYRHVLGLPLMILFLIYLCIDKKSFLYDILKSKLCNFFGNISFECYLIHILVLHLSLKYSKLYIYKMNNIIILFFVLLGVTIFIAIIYNKLEKFVKSKIISQTSLK